jgi:hypothetical protein
MLRQGFGKAISLYGPRAVQGKFLISEAGQNKQMPYLAGALAAGSAPPIAPVLSNQPHPEPRRTKPVRHKV